MAKNENHKANIKNPNKGTTEQNLRQKSREQRETAQPQSKREKVVLTAGN